jgi:hypothetical protein
VYRAPSWIAAALGCSVGVTRAKISDCVTFDGTNSTTNDLRTVGTAFVVVRFRDRPRAFRLGPATGHVLRREGGGCDCGNRVECGRIERGGTVESERQDDHNRQWHVGDPRRLQDRWRTRRLAWHHHERPGKYAYRPSTKRRALRCCRHRLHSTRRRRKRNSLLGLAQGANDCTVERRKLENKPKERPGCTHLRRGLTQQPVYFILEFLVGNVEAI